MKKVKGLVLVLVASAAVLSSCSYAGVSATPDGKAIVAQNNGLLFGMLNKIFVCQVTDAGLTDCQTSESP